jgi:flavin-dependent dehydrogenase
LERRQDVGARFHGDFQGLENWTTENDVLEELHSFGIATGFEATPFRECVLFDGAGREYVCRSERPLWYLVRRGTGVGTLDRSLKDQAMAAGVDLQFGHTVTHLPEGGIVAQGPRRVDAIAVGYIFSTDASDGAYGVVSDDLAPQGYGYLLICRGRATLATCMFSDFHNDKRYLARTAEFFERHVGITARAAESFGGFGNMAPSPTVRRGSILLSGEAAGLQDALFGFGMRYALASGHRAGAAWADQDLQAYESAYRRDTQPTIRAAVVNRYLYRRSGPRGYRAILNRLCGARDPREWLRRYYAGRWWTPLLFPVARAEARRRQIGTATQDCRENCDCTYCRCIREAAAAKSTVV